ncbi:Alpha-1,6-mannosylglycoprotein 6-beta-N-acetylglucosaminyltransferase A [Exaiptasia diaphana]|nr:Alpha-1,6-mannosylglycoprotein 6-beta-N-acetylglucosaminyltransferase A [Exaiptasia diaphana]
MQKDLIPFKLIHSKTCAVPSNWRYPFCKEKVLWLQLNWQSQQDCYVKQHNINTSDDCSILRFYSEAEGSCPLLPGREKPDPLLSRPKAYLHANQTASIGLTGLRDCKLKKRKTNLDNRPSQNILIYLGAFAFQNWFIATANSGGPLGELVQWTDVIASLYILGHNITLIAKGDDLKRNNNEFFMGKPTFRAVTSQHPYAEDFIGEPYVFTVDISNLIAVKIAAEKILRTEVKPYLPLEWTPEGMLERVNSFTENMDHGLQKQDSHDHLHDIDDNQQDYQDSRDLQSRDNEIIEISGPFCQSRLIHDGTSCWHDSPDTAVALDRLDNPDRFVPLHNTIFASGLPNYKGCRIPLKSNLQIPIWRNYLRTYEDRIVCDFLEFGWPVGYDYETFLFPVSQPRNHNGATQFPDNIDRYFREQISRAAIAGPFSDIPFQQGLAISPLNSVEKKDSTDRRVILDLSWPHNSSVNDGISKSMYEGENFELKFPTVDSIADLIVKNGSGCFIYKCDLKAAYRQFPVDPYDYPLLGSYWKNYYYFDVVLPMGLRSAAMACQRITNAITHICAEHGYNVVNYLDDFQGVEQEEKALQ